MKKLLRFLGVFLLAAAAFAVLPVLANADDGGSTGDCSWFFEESTRRLTISIPDGITGGTASYKPTAIYDNEAPWQQYCQMIEEIVIGEGVGSIGDYAFAGCFEARCVTLPKSLLVVGECSFKDCSSLEGIQFYEGFLMVDDYAFEGCGSLNEVMIPASCTKIEQGAFSGCGSLESITISNPECVLADHEDTIDATATICGYPDSTAKAYAEKYGRTFVELGASDIIEEETFTFDPNTGTLTILVDGEAVGVLPDEPPYPWTYLSLETKRVIFVDGLKAVATQACYGFMNLEEVIFPGTMESIGSLAFDGCSSLRSIDFPASITWIGSDAFLGCSSLTEIELPQGLEELLFGTFEDCTSLANVTLPAGLIKINDRVFYNTALSSITIPDSVTYIGYMSFGYRYIADTQVEEKLEGFMIRAACSSYACEYAKTQGFAFESTGGHKVLPVYRKATPTKDGKKVSTCIVCGKKGKTTIIPKASKISLSWTSKPYVSQKVQRPDVLVKDRTGKTIAKSNYTLTWSAKLSKLVGNYTVTVNFKGAFYSGSKTLTYSIVPNKVTGLKKTGVSANSISFRWTKVAEAKKYLVQWARDGEPFGGDYWTTSTKYSGSSFKAGTGYYLRVTASDAKGKVLGEPSNFLYIVTVCEAPELRISSPRSKTVKATWKAVKGAKKYVVYASLQKNDDYSKVATTTNPEAVIPVKYGGKRVYVKVRAVNSQGAYSAYSNRESVVVKK